MAKKKPSRSSANPPRSSPSSSPSSSPIANLVLDLKTAPLSSGLVSFSQVVSPGASPSNLGPVESPKQLALGFCAVNSVPGVVESGSPQVPKQISVSEIPPSCGFCKEYGHSLKNCPNAPITCSVCNSSEHTIDQCNQNKERAPGSKQVLKVGNSHKSSKQVKRDDDVILDGSQTDFGSQDISKTLEIPNGAITRSKAKELAKIMEDMLRKTQVKENEDVPSYINIIQAFEEDQDIH